jgi:hypothetical protein
MASGKVPVMDIDLNSCYKFREVFPNANFVFVCVENLELQKQNLTLRGTETIERAITRLNEGNDLMTRIMTLPEFKTWFTIRLIGGNSSTYQACINLQWALWRSIYALEYEVA